MAAEKCTTYSLLGWALRHSHQHSTQHERLEVEVCSALSECPEWTVQFDHPFSAHAASPQIGFERTTCLVLALKDELFDIEFLKSQSNSFRRYIKYLQMRYGFGMNVKNIMECTE
jgi:hypothetical protein